MAILENRVNAVESLIEKEESIKELSESSPIAETEGLSEHEIVALASVMKNQLSTSATVSTYTIRDEMRGAGYTGIATSLAIRSLTKKKLLSIISESDINGNEISSFQVAPEGERWLQDNISRLVIKRKSITKPSPSDSDIDIPF